MAKRKSPDAKLTLREFLAKRYMPNHDYIAKGTASSFRYALNRWERVTEDRSLKDITVDDLFVYRNSCKDLSASSANSYLALIFTLLRHAKQLSILSEAPEIPFLRVHRKLKPTPTLEELERMYEVTASAGLTWPKFEPAYLFWRRWLVVSYFTGFRLTDLMHNLTWDCIHADRIELTAKKTNWTHVIPMCDVLRSHLVRTVHDDNRIFPVSNSPHIIRRELRFLCEAAKVSVHVTPHALRRLSITEWSATGSELAGKLIHGCGRTSDVMMHYRGTLRVLQEARETLAVPKAFVVDQNQLQLFFDDTIRKPRPIQPPKDEHVIPVRSPFEYTDSADWWFGKDRFRFRGCTFPLRAEPLRVLKVLANAGGPVTPAEIAEHAFRHSKAKDEQHAKRRAKQAVSRLRRILRELLNLTREFDPIPNCGYGDDACWALNIPLSIKAPKLIDPDSRPGLRPQIIRMARKRAGWKLRDLARKVGVEAWTMTLWENGSLPVYESHADKLAKIIGPYLDDDDEMKVAG